MTAHAVISMKKYHEWIGTAGKARSGTVLHTGLGIFLKKIADVDCESFEFLVESLP